MSTDHEHPGHSDDHHHAHEAYAHQRGDDDHGHGQAAPARSWKGLSFGLYESQAGQPRSRRHARESSDLSDETSGRTRQLTGLSSVGNPPRHETGSDRCL